MATNARRKLPPTREGVGPVRTSDRLGRKRPDLPLAPSLTPAPTLALKNFMAEMDRHQIALAYDAVVSSGVL